MALEKSIISGKEHRRNGGHINWIPCMKKGCCCNWRVPKVRKNRFWTNLKKRELEEAYFEFNLKIVK